LLFLFVFFGLFNSITAGGLIFGSSFHFNKFTLPNFLPLPLQLSEHRKHKPVLQVSRSGYCLQPATPAPSIRTLAGRMVPAAVINMGKNVGSRRQLQELPYIRQR
jgi:hypothetical protein